MLVTFHTLAAGDVVMFGDIAVQPKTASIVSQSAEFLQSCRVSVVLFKNQLDSRLCTPRICLKNHRRDI